MWNPPIVLTAEEQKRAARTRKTRKFFVFLREHRHELLDADFQHTLANSYSPEPGGHEPVEAGLLALATLLQASGHVGDRDAVELTVRDKRWQMVLDGLGAEHPPCSQRMNYVGRSKSMVRALADRKFKRPFGTAPAGAPPAAHRTTSRGAVRSGHAA